MAEVLNRLVDRVVGAGLIGALEIGRKGVRLSHLQFADDTILFCSASYDTFLNYKRILVCFSVMLGLRINYEKTILIPIHYEEGWVIKVKNVLRCKVSSLPISYLYIPLGTNLNWVKEIK